MGVGGTGNGVEGGGHVDRLGGQGGGGWCPPTRRCFGGAGGTGGRAGGAAVDDVTGHVVPIGLGGCLRGSPIPWQPLRRADGC